MTRTEDLLRSALERAGTPSTRIADPLADLDRRVSRARRRISMTAAIAVFVVTAAVVVPLSLIGRGDSSPAVASAGRTLTTWATGHVVAVASGGGSIWSLEKPAPPAAHHADIVQRDPVTGAVRKRWSVGAGFDFIAYGEGKVWVWGGGDSAASRSIASALDPTTDIVSETAHLGHGNDFDSVVFAAGSAWAAVPQRNRLLSFAFQDRGTTVSTRTDRGIESVVRLGQDLVATVGRDGTIAPIQRQGALPNRKIAAGAHPWVPAADSTFWLSQHVLHRELLFRQDLTTLRKVGSTVTLATAPVGVVADQAGGLYVAEPDGTVLPPVPALSYYSAGALGARSPNPTAIRRFDVAAQLALDPAGGVVYTNGSGALIHWDPAGPTLR